FFFSSRRRHTRLQGDWSSDVCSSDLERFSFRRREEKRRAIDVLLLATERFVRGSEPDEVSTIRFTPFRDSKCQPWFRCAAPGRRSEERRVGKECRSRWARYD